MEGLGAATLAAQKALADKFNIVTFDTKGNISQVPTSGIVDPNINVGTGRFTSEAFAKSVQVLTQQIKPVAPQTNVFEDFVFKPITEAIDAIFGIVKEEDLDEAHKEMLRKIDAEIEAANKQLADLEQQLNNVGLNSGTGRAAASYNETRARSIIVSIEETKKLLTELKAKRANVFKLFASSKILTDQMKQLTDAMKKLLKEENITIELKAAMSKLIEQGSKLIEKMYLNNATITYSVIQDLQNAMLSLNIYTKEPIQQKAADLNTGLGFISEGIFGFATSLSEAFEKIFNPDVNTLTQQLVRIQIAQVQAARELSK